MEQHPIPRNVSGYEFHLVGDMTLKQFGYLSGGLVLAYFLFKMPFPAIINIPLAAISALAGLAFAFLPIQDRPLDRWLMAFIKSIYSPTQYLWHKNNPPPDILLHAYAVHPSVMSKEHIINNQIAKEKLAQYLAAMPPTLDATINLREKNYINHTLALFNSLNTPFVKTPSPAPLNPPPPVPAPSKPIDEKDKIAFSKANPLPAKPAPVKPVSTGDSTAKAAPPPSQTSESTTEKEEELKKQARQLEQSLSQNTITKEKFLELERKLNDLLSEKERLTEEVTSLRRKGADRVVAVKPVEVKSVDTRPTVKKLDLAGAKNTAGMPSVPQTPNIILGVIRDNFSHLLPNIIVSVKDLTGMPVRAIKTNKLGQFASATPLQNGEYLIEVEDPQKRYTFDTVEVTLTGQVFMPIEITAKGQREIIRDKLTKELFGQQSM